MMPTHDDLITYHPGSPDTGADHWHVECELHPAGRARLRRRKVWSPEHAANLAAKHLLEYHAGEDWPDLNLSAVATLVLMAATVENVEKASTDVWVDPDVLGPATATLGMWEALTGLPRAEAVALAQRVQASAEPVTAAVAPF